MTFGVLRRPSEGGGEMVFSDEVGELLDGVTFLVFGAVLLGPRSTSSAGASSSTRSRA